MTNSLSKTITDLMQMTIARNKTQTRGDGHEYKPVCSSIFPWSPPAEHSPSLTRCGTKVYGPNKQIHAHTSAHYLRLPQPHVSQPCFYLLLLPCCFGFGSWSHSNVCRLSASLPHISDLLKDLVLFCQWWIMMFFFFFKCANKKALKGLFGILFPGSDDKYVLKLNVKKMLGIVPPTGEGC